MNLWFLIRLRALSEVARRRATFRFCADMSLFHFTVLAAAVLSTACTVQPQTPGTVKQNYPSVIRDSTDRRAKAEREWRRMLDVYKVPQTPPDLYPTICTPRSLLGISGGIKLVNSQVDPGSEKLSLREAMKGFIDRWRDLIGADPASVSLVSADESGALQRFTYRQSNYGFPIAGIYGEMSAVVSKDGRLMQLDDRFIPLVELPAKPQIDLAAARQKVVGRTFTYSDIAGREQKVQVSRAEEVTVKQLVVLPIEKGDSLEIRLAWEVVAGSSLVWTVFIDAMNGEELRVVQNFNT
jgi:hypothetical protein